MGQKKVVSFDWLTDSLVIDSCSVFYLVDARLFGFKERETSLYCFMTGILLVCVFCFIIYDVFFVEE